MPVEGVLEEPDEPASGGVVDAGGLKEVVDPAAWVPPGDVPEAGGGLVPWPLHAPSKTVVISTPRMDPRRNLAIFAGNFCTIVLSMDQGWTPEPSVEKGVREGCAASIARAGCQCGARLTRLTVRAGG